MELHHRPSGYEPDELLLLHPALPPRGCLSAWPGPRTTGPAAGVATTCTDVQGETEVAMRAGRRLTPGAHLRGRNLRLTLHAG